MELKIYSKEKSETGKIKLPAQFQEPFREDLIKRAVEASRSNRRQPYGSDPRAGKKASADLSRRRRKYRGSYGFGISRVPRKILSRSGTRMSWVGAFAPFMVGGRRAHPPKPSKSWRKKVNKKESRKAIRSALSASINKEIVEKRGHKPPSDYPFALDGKMEDLSKTKDIVNILDKLGLKDEMARAGKKKIRAGRGKTRGRKYKKRKGPLFVVSKKCKLLDAVNNIPGAEGIIVNNLNTEVLAPGCHPGRLVLITSDAIKAITDKKMFM